MLSTLRDRLEKQLHGAMILTKEGLVAQVLGLPLLVKDKLVVIPKYIMSRERTPWGMQGMYFSRIIEEYGPRGLSEAVSLSRGLIESCFSDLFMTELPCIDVTKVLYLLEPREALKKIVSSPRNSLGLDVVNTLCLLKRSGVFLENLGITGSVALGIGNPEISDIDVVVYGGSASVQVLKFFLNNVKNKTFKGDLGGLRVIPPIDTSWRRGVVLGRYVSWIGVPEAPLGHCKVVRKLPPSKRCKATVSVKPLQTEALLYPPCSETSDGTYLVSFEYNLAYELYRGGVFEVRGICSEDKLIIYLGTREYPGIFRRLSSF